MFSMVRVLQLIFTLLFINALGHQKPKELGIGFVIPHNPYQYENGSHCNNIFSDKNLKTKSAILVEPFFYKPDYGLYHFICLSRTEKYYEILINNTVRGYLPNADNFIFTSWESLLINASVERITPNNDIYREPSTKSQALDYKCQPDRLKVEEVIEKNNEYWILVSFLPSCENPAISELSPNSGWIRWRTKTELLVNILLLC
jgi:hypothetical protein